MNAGENTNGKKRKCEYYGKCRIGTATSGIERIAIPTTSEKKRITD